MIPPSPVVKGIFLVIVLVIPPKYGVISTKSIIPILADGWKMELDNCAKMINDQDI
jgi:hypothetical protein